MSNCTLDFEGSMNSLDADRYKLHRMDAPDTSIAAAYVVDAEKDSAEVLRLVTVSGERGMTGFEVAKEMGRDYNTVSGRFSGLADKGLIQDSGMRRKSPRGVAAIVWVRGAGQPKPKKASRKDLIKLLRRVPDESYALSSDLLDAIFDALDAEDA
jgi:hypothetical protein